MTKKEILNTLQEELQKAHAIAEGLFQDFLDEPDQERSRWFLSEYNCWLCVEFELQTLLKIFNKEVES